MKRLYLMFGLILAILIFLPAVFNNYWMEIFILIFYYAYLGQCWNLLTGYTGNISLGHSLYVGIGAYTSTRLAMVFGLSPWVGMWEGALLATGIASYLGFLGFRFGLKSQKGNQSKLPRQTQTGKETLVIPKRKEIPRGTLKALFNQTSRFIPQSELRDFFYTDVCRESQNMLL